MKADRVKKIIEELGHKNISEVYAEAMNAPIKVLFDYTDSLKDKLNNIDSKPTPEEISEILLEIRWQALSTLAAKAAVDRQLKTSSVAGELLQKYEQIAEVSLISSLGKLAGLDLSQKLPLTDNEVSEEVCPPDKKKLLN